MADLYSDFGQNIAKAFARGWDYVNKVWLPLRVDSDAHLQVDVVSGVMSEGWSPVLTANTDANDSDKTITVPASTEWLVNSIYVALTSTATVGNRQLVVLYTDGSDNVLAEVRAGVVQAASLTYLYTFGLGMMDLTAARDTTYVACPLPAVVLPAGYKVRVYDSKAVDAAADDMTVRIMAQVRSV